MEDSSAAQVTWDLTYTRLTTDEIGGIQQLFEAAEGRLGIFTFLDPTANLLTWTEDLSQSTWTADPLLQMNAKIEDPSGTDGAYQLTNSGQIAQQLKQTISAPSSFQYCFSVYLRSETPCTVTITGASQDHQSRRTVNVGAAWIRAIAPVQLDSQREEIYFGIELPAGCRITMFGPQVEPQTGPGGYKKNTSRAGVYTDTRFDSDALMCTTTAPNQHSCSLRIKACVAG